MTIDDLVGRALTEMTEGLRPQPDPYGRVRARLQRSRRRMRAAVGLCMAAVVSATGATVIGPSHGGPTVIEPEPGWQTMLWWAERLADSPPRGAVGADATFVADLANRIAERQRAGAYRVKAPVRQVKVLFVDDIGSRRIALVAFALGQTDPSTQWPNAHRWFVAPRGASAEALVAASPDQGAGDGLEPFMSTTVSGEGVDPVEPISVGIAPAGCEFASAPLPEANAWQPEPTGSYIVRTKQAQRPEWWQITCDGIVRVSQPAPGSLISTPVTDAQLESAVGTARGTLDREQSRMAISFLAGGYGYAIKALPQVIWNGRTAGTEADANGSFDGRAVVVAAPAVRGGWLGEVQIVHDYSDGRSATGTGQSFTTDTDPTDPSSIVAVRLGQNTSTVLVVTPAEAATVRAVGGEGEVVAWTPVRDAGAVIKVANPDGIRIEALDARGVVIGRGKVVEQGGRDGSVDRWGEL